MGELVSLIIGKMLWTAWARLSRLSSCIVQVYAVCWHCTNLLLLLLLLLLNDACVMFSSQQVLALTRTLTRNGFVTCPTDEIRLEPPMSRLYMRCYCHMTPSQRDP